MMMTATERFYIGHFMTPSSILSRGIIALLCGGVFYLLALIYKDFVFVYFRYAGFSLVENPQLLVQSFLWVVLTAFLIDPFSQKVSDFVLFILIFSFVVPAAILYAYGVTEQKVLLLSLASWGGIFILTRLQLKLPAYSVITVDSFLLFCSFLSLLVLLLYMYTIGFDHFSYSFLDVYERRGIVDGVVAVNPILGYLFAFFGLASVLGVVFSFCYARWFFFLFFVFCSFLVFCFGGHKSYVFGILFMLFLFHLLKSKYSFYVMGFFVLLFVWGAYAYFMHDSRYFFEMSLFFRRTLFVPALLNQKYVDFFSSSGYLYWSYSKVGLGLVDYPLFFNPSLSVGMFMNTTASANTGIIGSGFMNAGYLGVAIYTVILGLFLAAFDSIVRTKACRILCILLTVRIFVIAMSSTDLPTVLFSMGLFLLFLLFFFLKSPSVMEKTY